jgi:hypothetical protein
VCSYFVVHCRIKHSAAANIPLSWLPNVIAVGLAGELFATAGEKRSAEGPSLKDLQAKIGQLAMENDFLAVALGRIDDASAKR